MTQIELIRQEIERRIKACKTKNGFPAGSTCAIRIETYEKLLSFLDTLEEPDFPTTDEEIEKFLASQPKVEVPEKYKTPDWLYKSLDQEPEVDLEEEYK